METAASSRERTAAFELKGTITPVTVLKLRSVDIEQVERELMARIAPVPQMFLHAPVVIDLGDIDPGQPISLIALAERLRRCKLIPVGAANLSGEQIPLAVAAGLAIMQLGPTRPRSDLPPAPSAAAPAPAPAEPRPPEANPTLTVRQAVRNGQVIYAQRADLVVLAPVNAGAQVIADGHIHIYGPLRGRALAGAQGMLDARVFCQSLEAELVSVAGRYLLADEIPADRRNQPAQLFVEEGHFRILPLA